MSRKKVLALVEPQVITAYKNGVSLKTLATMYECSVGTIRNTLLRNEVKMRPQGRSASNGNNTVEGVVREQRVGDSNEESPPPSDSYDSRDTTQDKVRIF